MKSLLPDSAKEKPLRIQITFLIVFCLFSCLATTTQSKEIDEYITEAENLNGRGELTQAIALLEKATAEHPGSSEAFTYLGFYTGMSAGQTGDFMEAGKLTSLSFELLGKAISLDPENPLAYLYRGIMGIKIPKFLGKLDGGIKDLYQAIEIYKESSSPESARMIITAWTMLAEGHESNDDTSGVRKALETIIELAPDSETATSAEKKLSTLSEPMEKPAGDSSSTINPTENDSDEISSIKKTPAENRENARVAFKLGQKYYDENSFNQARAALKECVALDPGNAAAYRLLALSTAGLAESYDARTYDDTNYRAALAFESFDYLDRAVEINPDDPEILLTRGIFGIMFPFFLNKHEQAVKDLEKISESNAAEDIKAEALFYRGVARNKEGMSYWIEVAKKYPESEAAKLVYNEMQPRIPKFNVSDYEKPFVKIDFVLGFRDELPPQTAIWIEDEKGDYVTTVYVSGFAGYVKENQITLPKWAMASGFEDTDGVTGASIDVGHHIYIWNLKDMHGKKIKKGIYRVKVEVAHWPTNKYQLAETSIRVGRKTESILLEEGNFIPFLEVTYHSR